MATFDQSEYQIRFEWGERGVAELAPISDFVVIVDVLSFSTCVDVASSRGATVFPFGWKDQRAEAYAAEHEAILAGRRGQGTYSLSPPIARRSSRSRQDRTAIPERLYPYSGSFRTRNRLGGVSPKPLRYRRLH